MPDEQKERADGEMLRMTIGFKWSRFGGALHLTYAG